MRVAINALASKGEGSLTYLLNILPELSRLASGIGFTVFANSGGAQKISTHIGRSQANFNIKVIEAANGSPIRRVIWEQTKLPGLLKEDRIDVLYAPAPPIPIHCPVPCVVAVRNMEPYCLHVWEQASASERMRYLYLRLVTGWSLRVATRIVLVSEATRSLLSAHHQFDHSRTTVIHHGCNVAFQPIPKDQAKKIVHERLGILVPFILYPSKTRPYKNHVELVQALALLRNRWGRGEHLIVAGEKQEPYYSVVLERVASLGLSNHVHFLGDVSYELLPALYNACEAFAYTSTCESCPNIVIEALGCGLPMAVSRVPAIEELCGDAVLYFNPFDPEAIAARLAGVLSNQQQEADLRTRALYRSTLYTWTETARRTLDVIQEAAVEASSG